ncbi:serine hydrolase [uncultured Roseibium sp.]|uniref:serine hydrolase domain-containing protein n=1 Tax=uncultured Roseibium sp. TaxID=1936171 RepID=UPI002601FDAB|nr:serine hydrolase [uncultured Roseibium sp.]
MLTRRVILSSLLAAVSRAPAVAWDLEAAPDARPEGWTVAEPASAGLDPEALSELVEMIDAGVTAPNVHAVLVEHKGQLVFEHYWPGEDGEYGYVEHGPETLHDIRSVTKSVTSLLLGVVLDGSAESALSRPIVSFFPELRGLQGELEAVTLHHVLTMTAGFAWNETIVPYDSQNDFIRLLSGDDPVGFTLAKEVRDEPGSRWLYNSGLSELVGGVIENLTGTALADYAEKVLFDPLQITEYEWWRPPAWTSEHFPSASAGLRLRARDLAKFGSLILHGGKWRGRRLVPDDWIAASTARHISNSWERFGYGYFWYPGVLYTGHKVIMASGWGDQRLYVVPDAGLAITIFAGNYESGGGVAGERIAGRIVRALR